MENRVNNDNYVVIQGWMINELQLKGSELIVFACIYGFSQTENQVFNGSLQYLADWSRCTKQGVIKALKSLEDKGFIHKTEFFKNNIKFCEYYSTKFNTLLNSVEYPIKQSLTGGIKQSLPNNIDIDKLEYKKEDKHRYGEYNHVLLTDKQLEKLNEDYGEEKTKEAIKYLDEYIQMKGYKCKDYNLALRKWVFKAVEENKPKESKLNILKELYDEENIKGSVRSWS